MIKRFKNTLNLNNRKIINIVLSITILLSCFIFTPMATGCYITEEQTGKEYPDIKEPAIDNVMSGEFFVIPGGDIVSARTKNSKVYDLGNGQKRILSSISSLHYKDNPADPDEQWKDIDTDIVVSPKENWDWEVVRGNWQLLINADTSIAIGKSDRWLGFRYEGFAYYDTSTKEYQILDTRNNVYPVISGNRIYWDDIFYGCNLEYIYTADGFKENLEITQQARDWCVAHPPSIYGLNNATTYLTGYIRCDWTAAPVPEDEDGTYLNLNNYESEGEPILWRHLINDEIISALPIGYAIHDDLAPEEWIKIRHRFFLHDNGNHYLLFGARLTDLNQYPAGPIKLDPTIDVDVAASADDAMTAGSSGYYDHTYIHWRMGDGYGTDHLTSSGRFLISSLPSGANVTNAFITQYATANQSGTTCQLYLWCEDIASSNATSSYNDFWNRNFTSTNTSWTPAAWVVGSSYNSSSFATQVQQVVDNQSGFDNEYLRVYVGDPNGESTNGAERYGASYDNVVYDPPKLIIEYSLAEGASAPTIITANASSLYCNSVTGQGNITATGGENPSLRGFQYGIGSFTDNVSEAGDFGTGNFSLSIPGLAANTEYQYRAFAQNSANISYGASVNFTTTASANPTVTTNAATSVSYYSAQLNATISGLTCANVTDWGFEWGTSPGSYSANWTDSGNIGNVSFNHTPALSINTTYYYRGFAATAVSGWQYGSEVSFSTLTITAPSVSTINVTCDANADDWIYTGSHDTFSSSYTSWRMGDGYTYEEMVSGGRFPVTVPAGANVTNAQLELTASSNQSINTCYAYIWVEDTANAVQISDNTDYLSRVWSDNVSWYPSACIYGNKYYSVNFNSLVQYLVDTYNGLDGYIQVATGDPNGESANGAERYAASMDNAYGLATPRLLITYIGTGNMTVITDPVNIITANTSRSHSTITMNQDSTANLSFLYGLSSGNYTYSTPNQTVMVNGNYHYDIENLSANTTYYLVAQAVGEITGTVTGNETSFTTKASNYNFNSIYYDGDEWAVLSTYNTSESHSSIYASIMAKAADYIDDEVPTEISDGDFWYWYEAAREIRDITETLAFAYQMTGDPDYAQAAIDQLVGIANWNYWNGAPTGVNSGDAGGTRWATAHMLRAMAGSYSMMKDFMSETDNTTVVNKMSYWTDNVCTYLDARYNYDGTEVPGGAFPNHWETLSSAIGLAGMSIGPSSDNYSKWMMVSSNGTNYYLDHYVFDDGTFSEAVAYYVSPMSFLVPYCEAYRHIDGIYGDFFETHADKLANFPYMLIYLTYEIQDVPTWIELSDTEWIGTRGMHPDHPNVYPNDDFLYLLAKKAEDGYVQFYADTYCSQDLVSNYIWRADNVTSDNISGLPLYRHFDDFGLVVDREDWTNDGLVTVFKCGTSAFHAHNDQNSFTIVNDNDWVTGNPGYCIYTEYATRMFNTLIFDDYIDPTDNITGGQTLEPGDYDNPEQSPWGTRGNITAVNVSDNYSRYRGDASAVYNGVTGSEWLQDTDNWTGSEGGTVVITIYEDLEDYFDMVAADIDEVYRDFLKVGNYYFVTYDRVANDSSVNATLCMNGDSLVHSAGVVTNNSTKMVTHIVYPEEYSIIDTTYDIDKSYIVHDYDVIRLSPLTANTTHHFLTINFIGASDNTTNLFQQNNLIGVSVNRSADRIDLALFSSNGSSVNETIELGDVFHAVDGGDYSFNGTQVQAVFDDFIFMQLAQGEGEEIVVPTVVTNAATSVEEETATLSGNITDTGGENANARRFEWDIDSGEPYANSWTDTTGNFTTGEFTHGISSLTPGELYYARASANNSAGWGPGGEITFLTKPNPASSFTSTDNGTDWISLSWSNGTGMDYVEIRYATGSAPSDNTSGTLGYWGSDTSANVSSLSENTTYYFRIWTHATEGGLWSTADNNPTCQDTTDVLVITAPTVTTSSATGVSDTAATLGGNITNTGGENCDTRAVQYGTSSGNYTGNQTSNGSYGTGAFSFGISGLAANTTYYFRAGAHNPTEGWGWGSELSFTTETETSDTESTGATTITIDTDSIAVSLNNLGTTFFQFTIVLAVIVLAFWTRDFIMFLISGIVIILIASIWTDDYPGIAVAFYGLAVYMIVKSILIIGTTSGSAQGWSQFKGLYQKVTGIIQKDK